MLHWMKNIVGKLQTNSVVSWKVEPQNVFNGSGQNEVWSIGTFKKITMFFLICKTFFNVTHILVSYRGIWKLVWTQQPREACIN